ncbi:MAG: FxsA family protein [Nitratireductor sp.]
MIPFFLLVVPIIEISLFVVVGNAIGLFPTLSIVLVTAVIGSILLRYQGISTLMAIRRDMNDGGLPGRELANGAMIVIAGILLLTPGFFTDSIGFLLFLPPVRAAIRQFVGSRIAINVTGVSGQGGGFASRGTGTRSGSRSYQQHDPGILDLDRDEYHEEPGTNTGTRS